MCGIVLVAGALTARDNRIFKTLLILDSLRGLDSTGLMAVPDGEAQPDVLKRVGDPFQLIDTKQYDRIVGRQNRVLLGHNRYATEGAVNVANAHPFEYGDVCGVHNGTLRNKHVLKDGHKFTVDSQAMYNSINEVGIKETIRGLNGSWALIWWNQKEQSLNFLRNKERPLWITYEKLTGVMFAASEPWMLDVALSREDVSFEEPTKLHEDVHVSITLKHDGTVKNYEEEEVKSSFVPFRQQSNVQSMPQKKHGGTGSQSETSKTSMQTAGTDTYTGTKNVTLEVVSRTKDHCGNPYYVCNDVSRKDLTGQIRLYINRATAESWIGRNVECNISERAFWDSSQISRPMYYKVQHSSVKLFDLPKEEETIVLPGGKRLTLKEWKALFTDTCSCCNADINPFVTEEYKYTASGDVVCRACVNDPEILQYLPALVN